MPTDRSLFFPRLAPFYARAEPYAYLVLRVLLGVALVAHGWSKIQNPFGAVGMVEGLGFYPGVVWSPMLAATEFFGGILIAIGLLTRPAAVAAFVVLIVTVYAHWIPFGEGYSGAEKSILWAAGLLYVAFAGGREMSADRALGREV